MTHINKPIIIVGFGHSGSRLLAELLSACGIFQVMPTPTKEWGYIQQINDRIWPTWYNLDGWSIEKVQTRAGMISKTGLFLRLVRRGYRGGAWCIKDPRLTVTLSAWLKRFPEARIVHLVRNPLDVVGTLTPNYAKFTPQGKSPQESLTFWSALWVRSLDVLMQSVQHVPRAIMVETRYEDLCRSPLEEVRKILEACHADMLFKNTIDVSAISASVDKYRQWLKDGRLQASDVEQIQSIAGNAMQRYGYQVYGE